MSNKMPIKPDNRQTSPSSHKQAKPVSKLPVKSNYMSTISSKTQSVPTESKQRKTANNLKTNVPNLQQEPSSKSDPSHEYTNIQEMVERFRFSKPAVKEKRETLNFWWNQSSDLESSELYECENDDTLSLDRKNDKENALIASKMFSENLKQLDLKAHDLIDKSESTLNDRFVSSEGVGSSMTTSNAESTYTRNYDTYSTEFTYKPEFVKYLQTKEQPLVFKSSEDILKQWRLRRKIEESRTNAVVDTNQREIAIFDPESFALRETAPAVFRHNSLKPNGIEVEQKKEVTRPAIANVQEKCTSFEISTQTCSDMAVQTSIEAERLERKLVFPNHDEKPTRDIDINKKKKSSSKSSSKSPVVKKNKHTKKTAINDDRSDLTKVSSIFDSYTNNKSQTVFASSSTKSSINNLAIAKQTTQLEPYHQEDTIDYESDEILSMLFKKLFFYQAKLNQIETLLQSVD